MDPPPAFRSPFERHKLADGAPLPQTGSSRVAANGGGTGLAAATPPLSSPSPLSPLGPDYEQRQQQLLLQIHMHQQQQLVLQQQLWQVQQQRQQLQQQQQPFQQQQQQPPPPPPPLPLPVGGGAVGAVSAAAAANDDFPMAIASADLDGLSLSLPSLPSELLPLVPPALPAAAAAPARGAPTGRGGRGRGRGRSGLGSRGGGPVDEQDLAPLGLGSRGGPVDARALARYYKIQRHRARRRGQCDEAAQAAEALSAQVAELEQRARALRAREGALRTYVGAQEALISTMRALELGGCGGGRRGEVLERSGGSATATSGSAGGAGGGGSAAAAAGAGAAGGGRGGSPSPVTSCVADAAGPAPAGKPAGQRVQVVDDLTSFAKAAAAFWGGGPDVPPNGSGDAAGGGGGCSSSAGGGAAPAAAAPPPVPSVSSSSSSSHGRAAAAAAAAVAATAAAAAALRQAVPSHKSSGRDISARYCRHARHYARILLALDAFFAQGDEAVSLALRDNPSALAVAAALRPRLVFDDDERARMRRVAAWVPPAALLPQHRHGRASVGREAAACGGGGEQEGHEEQQGDNDTHDTAAAADDGDDGDDDDDDDDYDQPHPGAPYLDAAGTLLFPERLLVDLAPTALAGEDPRDGPFGYRVSFARSWALPPEEVAWSYSVDLETGAPPRDGRGADDRTWLLAAKAIRGGMPPEKQRQLTTSLEIYESALRSVMAERRRLQEALRGGAGAGAAPGAEALVEALDANMRREDALTFVHEWSAFMLVDPITRARVVLCCWPYWLYSVPIMSALRGLIEADDAANAGANAHADARLAAPAAPAPAGRARRRR